MISVSGKFMSQNEEYFCQIDYDLFGEQTYLTTRFNTLNKFVPRTSIFKPVYVLVDFVVPKSFYILISDEMGSIHCFL